MLIRNAEVDFGRLADIRLEGGLIADMRPAGSTAPDAPGIDAGGNALLPGLHDHHIHLLAFAASLESVPCGPPSVMDEPTLIRALRARASERPDAWIRGIGYHESVAGDIDRDWLDRAVPSAPARIQHRSGRLWILNSRALDRLGGTDGPLETIAGRPTGRIYDGDRWLRERLGHTRPAIAVASRFLASCGVTGLTDATPSNGPDEVALFRAAQACGDLLQNVIMMGGDALATLGDAPGLGIGARKIHLREAALPDYAETCADIRRSHAIARPVAIHCTTLTELMFALGALADAGSLPGDRIEHASIAPPDVLPLVAELGLAVVTQPNFAAERGDAYLSDVDPADRPWLYRLRGFLDAGIPLAGGTDAPFGAADPWLAMAAAVSRRTAAGAVIGPDETLSPEEALGLFTSDPPASDSIKPGQPADLCLIDRPWALARANLADVAVVATIRSGEIIWPAQPSSASTSPQSSAVAAPIRRADKAR